MGMLIDCFDNEYGWLSNFAEAKINYEGKIYPTVEHAFQAAKTLNENEREKIRVSPTPGKAKRLGRKVTLRNDWESVKVDVMLELITDKFKNPEFRQLLINTVGSNLVEGNQWHDNFWGNCSCDKCQHKVGENRLGNILMCVRDFNILQTDVY